LVVSLFSFVTVFLRRNNMEEQHAAAARKEDDTVEEWEHPLFMKALPSADHPDAGTLEALSSLIYEDKTPEQLAEHFKQQVSPLPAASPPPPLTPPHRSARSCTEEIKMIMIYLWYLLIIII
jgi:hypothetical protein